MLGFNEKDHSFIFDDPYSKHVTRERIAIFSHVDRPFLADIMGFSFNFGGKLQFFAVTANLSIDPFKVNLAEGLMYAEKWESYFTGTVGCMHKSPT